MNNLDIRSQKQIVEQAVVGAEDTAVFASVPNLFQRWHGGATADTWGIHRHGTRFNHMYTIAFEVKSNHPTDKVEEREILAGLLGRIQNIVATQGLIFEAVGGPDDTFEEDN